MEYSKSFEKRKKIQNILPKNYIYETSVIRKKFLFTRIAVAVQYDDKFYVLESEQELGKNLEKLGYKVLIDDTEVNIFNY